MPIKVLTVVGARPQFIKAAIVTKEMSRRGTINQVLVHTGQHYDVNMSQVFFDELSIPEPDYNLGISGGTHGEMTGRMLMALEKVMLDERPNVVLLYGDTNSTLAGSLAASKLHIPIIHVEAGARTHSLNNPEELNRLCADHISSVLLACTEENLSNLEAENLQARSRFVGDPMYDAFLEYKEMASKPMLKDLETGNVMDTPSHYVYLTCHREENTSSSEVLSNIIGAMESLNVPVVYPVHPRNRATALDVKRKLSATNVLFVEPVGYLESIFLVNNADKVVTDSGGLQREAFFAGKKCVTVLDFEVWPETMVEGRNTLARPEKQSILAALNIPQSIDATYTPFGNGEASSKIVDAIEDIAKEKK